MRRKQLPATALNVATVKAIAGRQVANPMPGRVARPSR